MVHTSLCTTCHTEEEGFGGLGSPNQRSPMHSTCPMPKNKSLVPHEPNEKKS